jgi:UDP-glucuronate decarboxylase
MKRSLEIPSRLSRVLIAGGAGFLGSHLCDRLVARGHHVTVLDSFLTGSPANCAHLKGHPRFRLVRHDVVDPLPGDLAADVVFNLASPASPPRYQADPIHTMMTGVLGTRHLLDLAASCGAIFVQASTSEVYGDPEEHPQRETYWGHVNPTGPRACYDEGKRAAETLCFDYLRLGRADVRVARIFNTYGPRMQADDGRIVSNFIVQALTGRPLTVYGSGEQTRSFCYVSDLVAGLIALAAVERNPDGPVNLGNPGEFTVSDLARLVLDMTGSASEIVHHPLPEDDPRRRRPDIGLARHLLGWSPRVILSEGLGPTIEWFADSLDGKPAARRKPAQAGGAEPRAVV